MRHLRWPTLVVLICLLMVASIGLGTYHYIYPYGARPACLPNVLQALRSYSLEHGGSFPNATKAPLEALRGLYPRYLVDCRPLAGLSGDQELLEHQIAGNSQITEAASSWVYWPGLRSDDNPDIAIIWERKPGLRFNGSRAHGHEVGFIGGHMRQVADSAWNAFLKAQQELREAAVDGRTSGRNRAKTLSLTNSPPSAKHGGSE